MWGFALEPTQQGTWNSSCYSDEEENAFYFLCLVGLTTPLGSHELGHGQVLQGKGCEGPGHSLVLSAMSDCVFAYRMEKLTP